MLAINRKIAAQVEAAWDALEASPLDGERHLRQLLQLAREDENDHRKFMDSFREYHPHAAPVRICARQLAVSWLAKCVTGSAVFHIKDLMSTKPSVNYAASF